MALPDQSRRISELDEFVAALSEPYRTLFDRIFHLRLSVGQIVPPDAMHPWLTRQFGSVDATREQRIVKITNLVTLEGALFNGLRANQPIEAPPGTGDEEDMIEQTAGGPFCTPLEGTPADTFGRIEGRFSVSASNVAKYDGWHGVIVFREHDPLRFSLEQVDDYIETAQRWARAAHDADSEACYPFFLWNCLWRSGASILHGHAQMMLTGGMHYAHVEAWRQAALRYRHAYGSEYFADLVALYRALGLAIDHGTATVFPTLTPFKEKETHLVGPRLDRDLKEALYLTLHAFVKNLGVRTFNVVLYQPPLCPVEEEWAGFPYIFRVIDRGSLGSNRSDIGGMEMYAQSVVTTDPFGVARILTEAFPTGTGSAEHREGL